MTRRGAALAGLVVCLGGLAGFLVAHLSRVQGNLARVEVPTADRANADKGLSRAAADAGGQTAAGGSHTPSGHRAPDRLPDISLADAAGVKHRLTEWSGRPLLVNFWATWCEPCRREIPLLKALRHERSAQGVEVVGIAVDFADAVRSYSREMGIDYPVLIGEQDGLDAIAAFGVDTVFPFTAFADSQGRIVTLKIGELHAEDASLILDRIEEVDRGRLDLAAAREAITHGMAALAAKRAQAPDPGSSSRPQSR